MRVSLLSPVIKVEKGWLLIFLGFAAAHSRRVKSAVWSLSEQLKLELVILNHLLLVDHYLLVVFNNR